MPDYCEVSIGFPDNLKTLVRAVLILRLLKQLHPYEPMEQGDCKSAFWEVTLYLLSENIVSVPFVQAINLDLRKKLEILRKGAKIICTKTLSRK